MDFFDLHPQQPEDSSVFRAYRGILGGKMKYKNAARTFFNRLDRHLSTRTIADRIAEGLREIALLWFVFANLDIIVQTSHFSWAWSIKNTIVTALVWTFAVVLEAVIEKKGVNR